MKDAKDRAAQERAGWRYRAVAATRGTRLGAMILAAMGKQRNTRPQFVGQACITSDGYIMCSFIGKDGHHHQGAMAGDVRDLIANLHGLATHLKLSEDEARELFALVRGWIYADYRVKPDLDYKAGP